MVVLGMHRSGTSAMAGALAASGFQPPKTQMPARSENPSGYWESPVVADLNDEILAAQDASWDDVFPVDETSLLSNFGLFFLGKAADVLKAEFGDAQRIVLKDPRICLLANVWKRTLVEQGFRAHFVLVIRHPGEVAASLARRNEFSRDKSLLLWLSSLLSAERKTRGDSRSFVLFDDLLADPQGVLDRIEADLGQPLPRRTRMAEIEVERLVDRALRTHVHGDRSPRRGELNRLAHQAYEGLRAAARGDGPDPEMLDALARRLAEIEEVAGGIVSELRLHAHQLNARIGQEHSERQALAQQVAALEPLVTEAARVEALQAELEGERTSVRALHAQASELTLATAEAARSLDQQREAARVEAEALHQALAAERQAAELHRSELEGARADLARDAEQRRQLQLAHDALAHGLAAEQAAEEAARGRAADLDRLLTVMREADGRQQEAHRTELEQLTREIAAEQAAAKTAQAQAGSLEGVLAQTREAQARQQTADRAEIETLGHRLAAQEAAVQAASEHRLALEQDAARSADLLAAARAKADALAADLAQEQLGRFELADQTSALRAALAKAQAQASEAVAAADRRIAEREGQMADSHRALQQRFEGERSEGAKLRARLQDATAELAQAGGRHAQALHQLDANLDGERTAVRLMVADLVRVASELDAASSEAAGLRDDLQTERAERSSLQAEAVRLDALVETERTQSVQRLDEELQRSGALAAELASVKQMLVYLTTRWWWRAMTRAKGLAARG